MQQPPSLSSAGFTVAAKPGRDAGTLGLGVSAIASERVKLFACYEGPNRAYQTAHALTVGLKINW
jgi:uncharacterized protein with beta-barrel porin domain